jgi:hypothetical protein
MIRAFASKKSQTVTARLIVRRVHYLTKQAAAGQADLFRAWRYHAVFTDSPARPAGDRITVRDRTKTAVRTSWAPSTPNSPRASAHRPITASSSA